MSLYDSKRELICKNIFDTISTINAKSGYHTQLGTVERGLTDPETAKEFPAIYVYLAGETRTALHNEFQVVLTTTVVCYVKGLGEERTVALNRLLQDIENALQIDRNRGKDKNGNPCAVDTMISNIEVYEGWFSDLVIAKLSVVCEYVYLRGAL